MKGFGIKRKLYRAAALTLIMTVAGTGVISSYAASEPVCDETLYVTMDGSGNVTDASIVKSYELHGAKEITDHGTYSSVKNLTGYGKPQTDGDSVTFAIDQRPENDRFYFEGVLDAEQVQDELPWTIEVSYRLNGVDTELEDLAHATGLVEIGVDVTPNPDADEYYRNNMTLELSAVVDMDKTLSVEAPGAQIQSAGNLKAILFLLLPGEEKHCDIRIGTEDFSFSGLAFMMEPVTLGQLDDLDELRDAKAEVEDSADAISDSLDVILDSLESMKGGLSETADGLRRLDESRKIISTAKDGIYADSDTALAALKELEDRGESFPDYIETARKALSDLNRDMNAISSTVGLFGGQLHNLQLSIRGLARDLDDLSDLVRHSRHDIASFDSVLANLRIDLQEIRDDRAQLNRELESLKKLLEEVKALKKQVEEHGGVIGLTPELKQQLFQTVGAILGETQLPESVRQQILRELGALVESASDAIASGGVTPEQIQTASVSIDRLIALLEGLIGTAEQTTKLDDLVYDAEWTAQKLEKALSRVHEDGEPLEDVLADTGDLTSRLGRGAETAQELVEDTQRITRTVNNYHLTTSAALKDAGQMAESALRGTDAMYVLMSDLENTLKTAGEPLDAGAGSAISGLGDALDHAVEGLDKLSTVRKAKDTVEDLADEKWDEYTEEKMRLLNVDSDAQKVSFTSAENPEPQSIQIILRTAGTSEEKAEAETDIDEDFHPHGNFFQRIASVFAAIVSAVRGLFGK